MSSDSLALFRRDNHSANLKKLAEEHFQNDLQQSDRDALKSAAGKLSTHVTVGSLVGLGLGAFLAFRLRQNRVRLFNAFQTTRKPTHVKFADGREEAIPDLTPLMQPTRMGDVATYSFFAFVGLFLGGEVGVLTGLGASKRAVNADPASKKRVEEAYRAFRVDVLRKEMQALESGQGERVFD